MMHSDSSVAIIFLGRGSLYWKKHVSHDFIHYDRRCIIHIMRSNVMSATATGITYLNICRFDVRRGRIRIGSFQDRQRETLIVVSVVPRNDILRGIIAPATGETNEMLTPVVRELILKASTRIVGDYGFDVSYTPQSWTSRKIAHSRVRRYPVCCSILPRYDV